MKNFYKAEEKKGYNEIIGAGSGLDYTRLGLIRLEKGESITKESGTCELCLVLISGGCDVECEGEKYQNLYRKDVFSAKPIGVYVPRDSKYTVKATGEGMLEIAVCMTEAGKKYKPFLVKQSDTITEHRGKLNWQRDVVDIISYKYEGMVDRIVLGETFCHPGQWSSYPSHKHDTDNLPYEVNMEEIYYYKASPSQGFAFQALYTGDSSISECHIVKAGDSFAIKNGYHPVAAAPGYRFYYLWLMGGNSGRELTPNDDPKHAWVKSVEAMV